MLNQKSPVQIRGGILRPQPPDGGQVIAVGDFTADPETYTFTLLGQRIRLTPKEFELLLYFALNPGKVLTHEILSEAVWTEQATDRRANLRVMIGQLRRKLAARSGKQYLLTEPWLGYRFVPDGVSE